MANTKISQLPSWTGTAADLRWFVMNNSGETETFKFSGYTSQLIPGPGTNSYSTINAGTPNVNSPADDITIGNNTRTSSGAGGIAIGKNAIAGGVIRKAVAIGQDTSATNGGINLGYSSTANGDSSVNLGLSNNSSAESSITIGQESNATANYTIAIGRLVNARGAKSVSMGFNIPNRTGTSNIVIGDAADTNSNNPSNDIAMGVNARTSGGAGGIAIGKNAIAGGIIRKGVAIGEDTSATSTGIIVGWSASANGDGACALGILNTATQESSVAVGVLVNTTGTHAVGMGRDVTSSGVRGVAIGKSSSVSRTDSVSVGGNNNTINNGVRQSIFGGTSNTISSSNNGNTIINGSSCQITGTTSGSTIIGLSNFTDATENDTTYLDNLQVLGQAKYGNYNNGNGGTSYMIDWDNGNIQKITLTANTTFSATNITDGTTYIFKVQQDGIGSNTGTFNSTQFKFPNSTPPTLSTAPNAVDILTFAAMDGVLYGVAQLNFG